MENISQEKVEPEFCNDANHILVHRSKRVINTAPYGQ